MKGMGRKMKKTFESYSYIPLQQQIIILICTDLIRKELNALTSVAVMLWGADSIKGEIEPESSVKKQLFIDNQETISNDALLACSKTVNFLRKVSLKGREEASFLACYHFRNLRETHWWNLQARRPNIIPKDSCFQKASQSILVKHATLKLPFQKKNTLCLTWTAIPSHHIKAFKAINNRRRSFFPTLLIGRKFNVLQRSRSWNRHSSLILITSTISSG